MSKPSGYVIYQGKSNINGEPIVAIVTMKSSNIKTGNMASMWILHEDVRPTEASKTGKDEAICGMCPHRHHLGGSCYVTLHQAPLSVWKAYKRGNYTVTDDMSVFEGLNVRFGAYGDPYAIPVDVLTRIKAVSKNNTSYTHQWKQACDSLKAVSMASVDNIEEAKLAVADKWRTFRVTNDITDLMENEIVCPNTTNNVQCIDCGLCKGNSIDAKSIVIQIHGNKKAKFKEA